MLRWLLPMVLLATSPACSEEDDAPSVRQACERLTELCGEELGFEVESCVLEAEIEPKPTDDERRCLAKAKSCRRAMACGSADAGMPDAGG